MRKTVKAVAVIAVALVLCVGFYLLAKTTAVPDATDASWPPGRYPGDLPIKIGLQGLLPVIAGAVISGILALYIRKWMS